MLQQLTILGGSSPFTVGLIDALRGSWPTDGFMHIQLHGRNLVNLRRMRDYAEASLASQPCTVSYTDSIEHALDGADAVLHQVRYGGFAERSRDEDFAANHNVLPDESLGPAGLRAAIRMAPELQRLATLLRTYCPNAWVLNMTNPLSVAVALLAHHGVRNVLGLCELPLVTARIICARLGIREQDLRWSYAGLNHRGFLYDFQLAETRSTPSSPASPTTTALNQGPYDNNDDDILGQLVRALATARTAQQGSPYQPNINGISDDVIRSLGAVPLKYYRYLSGDVTISRGRAQSVALVREQIEAELQSHPHMQPTSLGQRSMDWYPLAVVPMLAALAAGDGQIHVANYVEASTGLAREAKVRVYSDRVEPVPSASPPPQVQTWMQRLVAHERAVVTAALDPSRSHIAAALEADPLVPANHARALARALSADGVMRNEQQASI